MAVKLEVRRWRCCFMVWRKMLFHPVFCYLYKMLMFSFIVISVSVPVSVCVYVCVVRFCVGMSVFVNWSVVWASSIVNYLPSVYGFGVFHRLDSSVGGFPPLCQDALHCLGVVGHWNKNWTINTVRCGTLTFSELETDVNHVCVDHQQTWSRWQAKGSSVSKQ